jgi:hypothetical protein
VEAYAIKHVLRCCSAVDAWVSDCSARHIPSLLQQMMQLFGAVHLLSAASSFEVAAGAAL